MSLPLSSLSLSLSPLSSLSLLSLFLSFSLSLCQQHANAITPVAGGSSAARFSKTPGGFATPAVGKAKGGKTGKTVVDVTDSTVVAKNKQAKLAKEKKKLKEDMVTLHAAHLELKASGSHEEANQVALKYNKVTAQHVAVKRKLQKHKSRAAGASGLTPMSKQEVDLHVSQKKQLKSAMKTLKGHFHAAEAANQPDKADLVAKEYNTTAKRYASVRQRLEAAGYTGKSKGGAEEGRGGVDGAAAPPTIAGGLEWVVGRDHGNVIWMNTKTGEKTTTNPLV